MNLTWGNKYYLVVLTLAAMEILQQFPALDSSLYDKLEKYFLVVCFFIYHFLPSLFFVVCRGVRRRGTPTIFQGFFTSFIKLRDFGVVEQKCDLFLRWVTVAADSMQFRLLPHSSSIKRTLHVTGLHGNVIDAAKHQ